MERGVEISRLVQAVQLALVGEDEVYGARADQIQEFRAITINAERIRQREGDIALCVMCDLRRLEESFLGARGIPEIALEVDNLSGSNGIFVDVVGMQILGGAEIGVHRALAVGRDQHVAARCRWAGRGRGCRKRDASRADVVGKDATELVVLDLADEGRARTEACYAYDGIRRRAAGNLHRRTHGIVEFRGLALIDQLHGALAHIVLGEKRVIRARDHIDNRIADTKNVETYRGHLKTLTKNARAL